MYLFLYDFGIRLYYRAIKVSALFRPKAKQWSDGRYDLLKVLKEVIDLKNIDNQPFIWFHCASLGEFEQGRPLIEAIKKRNSNEKILLTFFSPSGYEIRKNYAFADVVAYLPLDTKQNVQQFLDIVRPKMVFWVKYEFWYRFLEALHERNIPTFLVSGIFRKNHFFFSPFGKSHRKCLNFFEHLFLQNQTSKNNLQQIRCLHTTVTGDTRLDRVLTIAAEQKRFEIVEAFVRKDERPIIICGSTWQPDETILSTYINAHNTLLPFRFIIAPHEINELKINLLKEKIKRPSIRYSEAKINDVGNFDLLIIDNIGMLSALYHYGKLAYIGGAFGSGLHNTLEPIVFGLPVIFGPKYQKFEEAVHLVEAKGGFSIKDYEDFCTIIQALENEDFYKKAAKTAKKYVTDHQGATSKIIHSVHIQQLLG